jgi:hypothetical protein
MSAQKPHNRGTNVEFQVVGALLLIALGAIFLAQQAGYLSRSANWWVIFLALPGLGLLWNAYTNYRQVRTVNALQVIEVTLGAVLLLLTVIFIVDPTWGFTRGWTLFSGTFWDQAWPFFLVVPGVLMVAVALLRGWAVIGVLGAVMTIVGGVFVFDIDWNYVWPLALILPGVWWLYNSFRRRTE